MMSRRSFSRELQSEAVRRLANGQSVAEVARAEEVHPSELYRWRGNRDEHGERAFQGPQSSTGGDFISISQDLV